MSNKPIISLDIDDKQFKAVAELLAQFSEKIQKLPDEFRATNTHIKATATSTSALAVGVNSATNAHKQFNAIANQGLLTMGKMTKQAGLLSQSIFGMGKFLLKIGAIGGGIAGLGGIFGTFSLTRLADAAVSAQREARGVGLNPGQYKSFGLDFSRFIDPSILDKVANAQNSYQGRVWLGLSTGLNQSSVINQRPDQLASQILLRAHDWWGETPAPQRTAENLKATGFLDSGLGLDDMRRLGNTPRAELMRAQQQYNIDQKTLNIGDRQADLWYGFDRQLKLAGKTIENILINKLSELGPSFSALSQSIMKDVEIIVNQLLTPENIKSFSDAIRNFSEFIGSDRFKKEVKSFIGDIGLMAGGIHKLLSMLGIKSNEDDIPDHLDPDEFRREAKGLIGPDGLQYKMDLVDGISPKNAKEGIAFHNATMPKNPEMILSDLDKRYNLPSGTLSGVWQEESAKGKNLIGVPLRNGDQAIGDFQFTSGTWKDWSHFGENRFSFSDEARNAGRYLESLKKMYHGDIKKALAAYNYGPEHINDLVKTNGKNWENGLPSETKAYIDDIAKYINKKLNYKVTLDIKNNTASKLSTQANAAGAG